MNLHNRRIASCHCSWNRRGKIFDDDKDREWSLDRLGGIWGDGDTACLAWALFPDHFHLLLETEGVPLSHVMRRLIRCVGGWSELKALRKAGNYPKGDEHILSDSDFVLNVQKQSDVHLERKYSRPSQGYDLDRIATRVAQLLDMPVDLIFAAGGETVRRFVHEVCCAIGR